MDPLEITTPDLGYGPEEVMLNGVPYTRKIPRPLQVGDFVRVERDTTDRDPRESLIGKAGKVVHFRMGEYLPIAVEFAEDIGGHDCAHQTRYGHGWYFDPSQLERIE